MATTCNLPISRRRRSGSTVRTGPRSARSRTSVTSSNFTPTTCAGVSAPRMHVAALPGGSRGRRDPRTGLGEPARPIAARAGCHGVWGERA